MRAVDIIISEIENQGITQQKAADMAGFTRQRLWDVLDKRNPRFQTMQKIMGAFGFRICLIDQESGLLRSQEETDGFVKVCEEENIPYDSLVRILEAVGIVVDLEKIE